MSFKNLLLPPFCCEQRIKEREANEKAGAKYPDDWDACASCVPGTFFREHPVPPSCTYVWELYRMIEGGCAGTYGAGPTFFDMILAEHGSQGFLIIVDFLNEIETQKVNVLNKKKLADVEVRQRKVDDTIARMNRR